jgi:hypothetical protein
MFREVRLARMNAPSLPAKPSLLKRAINAILRCSIVLAHADERTGSHGRNA